MKKENKLKKFPIHKSDEEAQQFVADADLSEFDFVSRSFGVLL